MFVGYRGYQRSGVKVLFPFGYGLSYTTFRYRNLSVLPVTNSAAAQGAVAQSQLTKSRGTSRTLGNVLALTCQKSTSAKFIPTCRDPPRN